jgi:hypothetical protein
MSLGLSVMVDDLEQIMLCVFKDHEDAFVLEDNFFQLNDIWMRELCA